MPKHELTANLASPESLEALALSAGVEGAVKGSPEPTGGVKLSVRAGDAAGYGVRDWDVVVGGEGLGADEDVSWGGYPRGPVLVRFVQPFLHMPGVDDAGICDGSFWKDMSLPPTLTCISQRLVEWLQGRQVPQDDDEALLAWREAQTHTAGKVAAMETFRKDLAPHAEALLGFGSVENAALNLSPAGDLREAAANLFAMLRALDAQVSKIAVSPIPARGIGLAINDRLSRAAAPR